MLDLKTGEIEEDKKRALREMMEKLADEIVQKKTALREKQLAEVRINETNKSMKLINQCFSSFYKVKYLKQLKLYSAQFVND